MSKLTPVDYDKVLKALISIGYIINNRGAAILLCGLLINKGTYLYSVAEKRVHGVVPAHKPIGKGMVRTIIREVDFSVDEFYSLLKEVLYIGLYWHTRKTSILEKWKLFLV